MTQNFFGLDLSKVLLLLVEIGSKIWKLQEETRRAYNPTCFAELLGRLQHDGISEKRSKVQSAHSWITVPPVNHHAPLTGSSRIHCYQKSLKDTFCRRLSKSPGVQFVKYITFDNLITPHRLWEIIISGKLISFILFILFTRRGFLLDKSRLQPSQGSGLILMCYLDCSQKANRSYAFELLIRNKPSHWGKC